MSATPTLIQPTLAHVADRYQRYPGDQVQLSTRVTIDPQGVGVAAGNYTLSLTLEEGLTLERYTLVCHPTMPAQQRVSHQSAEQNITWWVESPALQIDFEVIACVTQDVYVMLETVKEEMTTNDEATSESDLPNTWDRYPRKPEFVALSSFATVYTSSTAEPIGAKLVLHVYGRANYLQYLPAIYEQDFFLNRFLIFFESYWRPLQQQLDQLEHYFDPMLTPAVWLPWLASWFDWQFEEDWPLEAAQRDRWRRTLLHFPISPPPPASSQPGSALAASPGETFFRNVLYLHRTRGTRAGLQQLIELYTGGRVEIDEYTLHPLRLGAGAQLGRGIALYDDARQQPHTFTVKVRLPAGLYTAPAALAQLSERIKTLIAREKPAHTVAKLEITVEPLLII